MTPFFARDDFQSIKLVVNPREIEGHAEMLCISGHQWSEILLTAEDCRKLSDYLATIAPQLEDAERDFNADK